MPQFRVEPALEQDLDAAGRHGLVDLGGQFLFAERIAAGPARGAVEGAEAAVDVADVRVVDVPFDDVRHPPAGMQLVAADVGRQPQIGQRGLGRQAARPRPPTAGGRRRLCSRGGRGVGCVGGDQIGDSRQVPVMHVTRRLECVSEGCDKTMKVTRRTTPVVPSGRIVVTCYRCTTVS